jgi:hypothetical protein
VRGWNEGVEGHQHRGSGDRRGTALGVCARGTHCSPRGTQQRCSLDPEDPLGSGLWVWANKCLLFLEHTSENYLLAGAPKAMAKMAHTRQRLMMVDVMVPISHETKKNCEEL